MKNKNNTMVLAVILIAVALLLNVFISSPKDDEFDIDIPSSAAVVADSQPASIIQASDEIPEEIVALAYTAILEDGIYTDKENVALYLNTYAHLPSNYITKDEAKALGWPDNGSLDKVAPGKSIGGDKFGNREGNLPKEKGRQYFECDIDYVGGSRNAKRIVYSNDGLIYYTEDHYNTFTLLYGEE